MNCRQVRDLLSRYLENDLDASKKQLLNEHLAVCISCAKELEALKGMLVDLRGIPEVQPPPYFLQAVHARLEKEPAFNRILRKLFVPFYIKIPMEAIAVTATVIVIVVLVQKSQIGRITPVGMPVYTQYEPYRHRIGAQSIESDGQAKDVESISKEFAFPEIHSRDMASQITAADLQPMMQQQQGLSAKEYSGAGAQLDSAGNVLAEQAQSLDDEAAQIKKGYWESKNKINAADMALKATPAQPIDLAKAQFASGKEIILKTQQLDQDISKLGVILRELGIADINIEYHPEKALFGFSIPADQLEALLSRLKDWQIVSLPAKDIAVKEEATLEPVSVKLTLTTQ